MVKSFVFFVGTGLLSVTNAYAPALPLYQNGGVLEDFTGMRNANMIFGKGKAKKEAFVEQVEKTRVPSGLGKTFDEQFDLKLPKSAGSFAKAFDKTIYKFDGTTLDDVDVANYYDNVAVDMPQMYAAKKTETAVKESPNKYKPSGFGKGFDEQFDLALPKSAGPFAQSFDKTIRNNKVSKFDASNIVGGNVAYANPEYFIPQYYEMAETERKEEKAPAGQERVPSGLGKGFDDQFELKLPASAGNFAKSFDKTWKRAKQN